MAPQLTIKYVLILIVAGVCTLGAAPLCAYGPDDEGTFEEKPLPEFLAAMPAIRINAYPQTRPLAIDQSPRGKMFDSRSTPLAAARTP